LIKEEVGRNERGKILITVIYGYVERQTPLFTFPVYRLQIEIATWNWLLHSIDRKILGKEN
jgi:hypothetical protein